RVERPGNRADVLRAPFRHLRRVVARFDPASRLDQVAHRPCHASHAARNSNGDQDDDEDREQKERKGRVGVALPTFAAEDGPDEAPGQQRDQKHSQYEAANPADEWRRSVAAATPPFWWKWLALRPPRRAAARRRSPAAAGI